VTIEACRADLHRNRYDRSRVQFHNQEDTANWCQAIAGNETVCHCVEVLLANSSALTALIARCRGKSTLRGAGRLVIHKHFETAEFSCSSLPEPYVHSAGQYTSCCLTLGGGGEPDYLSGFQ
jgi:hypothetical protein